MTKRELIKWIAANSGENESWGNLVTKKKVELEQIYEYLNKVKEFEGETPEPVEETKGLEYSEDYSEHFVENPLVEKTSATAIFDLEEKEELPQEIKVEIDEPVEENVLETNEFDKSVGEEGVSIFEEPLKLKEEIDEIVEEEIVVPKKKIINDGQEYVSHKKPSGMNAIERKTFERTGRLPKKKVKQNKYTRFDNEDVKFGF